VPVRGSEHERTRAHKGPCLIRMVTSAQEQQDSLRIPLCRRV
jgi:hypothetical protein